MSEWDDCDVENILESPMAKKRKNSKRKGKRGELELVQLLNERFGTQAFSRVVGSGNRWSQVQFATKDYIGDVVCPDNFRFCIECKCGYQEIDLYRALAGCEKQLDQFLSQATDDAARIAKEPLLCWKKDRQPWLAFVRAKVVAEQLPENTISYKGWVGLALASLLALPDTTFLT